MPTLQAIKFDKEEKTLEVLDQLLIPFKEQYIPIHSIADGYAVIKSMQVRGAPAIAIVGALSIVVELNYVLNGGNVEVKYDIENLESFKSILQQRIKFLVSSRPTAVNLSNAATDIVDKFIKGDSATSPKQLLKEIFGYAVALFEDDLTNNYKLGKNGAQYMLQELKNQGYKGAFSIITICNTGSLATSGHGTALGIIRSLWGVSKANTDQETKLKKAKLDKPEAADDAWLEHVIPLETRPYNQGSRLTAFELVYEEIPATLITDSMVSFLLDSIASGRKTDIPPVKFVVVGADRIAANGDTANKIGTLQLARLVSGIPGIKFIVAAPTTTIDAKTSLGADIVVEERPANELRQIKGGLSGTPEIVSVQVAPDRIAVWNPSFDVTPHELIDSIVTEKEVLTKKDGEFKI